AAVLDAREADDVFVVRTYARKQTFKHAVVKLDAVGLQLRAQPRDRVRAVPVHIWIQVQRTAFDDLCVVVDVHGERRAERRDERLFAVHGPFDLFGGDGPTVSRVDLLGQIEQVGLQHAHAAVRDEIAEIARAVRL